MPVEDIPAEERKRLLEIAFKEHYLRWIQGDSEDYHQIHRIDGGTLKAPILRRIAERYRVNRGIRRLEGGKGDPIGEELAEILTAAVPDLADRPIRDRWNATESVAEDCRRAMQQRFKNHKVKPIVSGVTKLTWFLAPRGWTMYDRLTRESVGVGRMATAKQATEFYDQLSRRQFCSRVETMQAVLKDHGFENLFAERVIDKFLMLAGLSHVDVEKWSRRVEQFIYALHERHATEVCCCAHDLAALADDQFMVAEPPNS